MITVRIIGLDKLEKKMSGLPAILALELSNAIKKSAYLIEGKAKEVTPVITGYLRGSIRSEITRHRAIVAPHAEYAPMVHARKPFMKWGAEKAAPGIKKIFESAINKALRR